MTRTSLCLFLGLAACAASSDNAPPTPPDPGPAAVASAEAEEEEEGDDADATPAASEPAAAEPAKPAAAAKDVIGVVAGLGDATIFNELLAAAGDLQKQLQSQEGAGYTLLVPTDAAFGRLPKGTVDRLKKNTNELERVIKYHIVPGTHDVAKLANYRTAPTALGTDVKVTSQDNDLMFDGGKLLEVDLPASNGYVHRLDKVLMPKK